MRGGRGPAPPAPAPSRAATRADTAPCARGSGIRAGAGPGRRPRGSPRTPGGSRERSATADRRPPRTWRGSPSATSRRGAPHPGRAGRHSARVAGPRARGEPPARRSCRRSRSGCASRSHRSSSSMARSSSSSPPTSASRARRRSVAETSGSQPATSRSKTRPDQTAAGSTVSCALSARRDAGRGSRRRRPRVMRGEGELALEIVRRPLVVVVEKGHPLAARLREGRVPRPADAVVLLVPEDAQARSVEAREHLGRGVGRAVVHDEDLEVRDGLGADAREGPAHQVGAVPRGDDGGHERRGLRPGRRRRPAAAGSSALTPGAPSRAVGRRRAPRGRDCRPPGPPARRRRRPGAPPRPAAARPRARRRDGQVRVARARAVDDLARERGHLPPDPVRPALRAPWRPRVTDTADAPSRAQSASASSATGLQRSPMASRISGSSMHT